MYSRRAVYPLTIVLTLATVVGVFAAGWVLANPAVADPGPVASGETIRAFYAGINQTIRTGDSTALESAVAEHVVTHGPLASLAPDRAGLTRYLLSLHATSPHVELTAGEITTSGNRAMVNVSVTGANDGAFLGSPLAGLSPWSEVDAVRIDNHRVVELWTTGTGLALLEPLARAKLALDPARDYLVGLDRLSIPEDTSIVAPGTAELRWLHVEAGNVSVEGQKDQAVSLIATPAMESTGADVARTLVRPGELLGMPAGSRITVHNVGHESASVLVLSISSRPTNGSSLDPAYPQGQPSTVGETDLPKWWTGDRPITMMPVSATSLASSISLSIPVAQLEIATGQATLGPNASIADFDVPGSSLLVVNSGTLDVVSEEGPMTSRQDASKDQSAGRLDDESAGALIPHAHVDLHNPAAQPAAVTIFSLLPARAL